jgi:Golgi phosphoprotein 3 (GPP34)
MDELGDDLLLLATGSGQQRGILAKLRFGLSGSELVRLAAARRVDIVRRRIVVLGAAPTGDALLDDALRSMTGGRRQPSAKAWVARQRPGLVERGLARWQRPGLVERYLARLEAAGTIRVERRMVLGFIPSTRWVIVDTARAAQARDRLQAVATDTGSVDSARAALAGLASATGVAAHLYPGTAGAAARNRLEQAARRDPAAGTVTRAVIGAIDATQVVGSGIVGAVAGGLLENLIEYHTLSIHSFHATNLVGWAIGAFAGYLLMRRLTGLELRRRR